MPPFLHSKNDFHELCFHAKVTNSSQRFIPHPLRHLSIWLKDLLFYVLCSIFLALCGWKGVILSFSDMDLELGKKMRGRNVLL